MKWAMARTTSPKDLSPSKEASKPQESSRKTRILRFLQRLIKTFALFVLTLILIVQTAQCLKKYFRNPTFTSTRVVDQMEGDFPVITVCPDGEGYNETFLQENGFESMKHYFHHQYDLHWTSNNSNLDSKALFYGATLGLKDVFKYIRVRTFHEDPEDGSYNIFVDLNENSEHMNMFQEQRHRKFGRCYSFRPDDKTLARGIYYIRFQFRTNTKIYLHRKGQFLNFNGRMGYKVKLGESYQSQLNFEDIEMIPKKNDDGNFLCSELLYDECIYSALTSVMMDSVQCTTPWIPGTKHICKDLDAVNQTFWIAWSRITNQKKDCLPPCHTLLISSGAKNTAKLENNDYGQYYFFFAPRIVKSKEEYFYTFLTLMAEIGGYVGLLLGVSLFHLAGWIGDILENQIKLEEKKLEQKHQKKSSVLPTDDND